MVALQCKELDHEHPINIAKVQTPFFSFKLMKLHFRARVKQVVVIGNRIVHTGQTAAR